MPSTKKVNELLRKRLQDSKKSYNSLTVETKDTQTVEVVKDVVGKQKTKVQEPRSARELRTQIVNKPVQISDAVRKLLEEEDANPSPTTPVDKKLSAEERAAMLQSLLNEETPTPPVTQTSPSKKR